MSHIFAALLNVFLMIYCGIFCSVSSAIFVLLSFYVSVLLFCSPFMLIVCCFLWFFGLLGVISAFCIVFVCSWFFWDRSWHILVVLILCNIVHTNLDTRNITFCSLFPSLSYPSICSQVALIVFWALRLFSLPFFLVWAHFWGQFGGVIFAPSCLAWKHGNVNKSARAPLCPSVSFTLLHPHHHTYPRP